MLRRGGNLILLDEPTNDLDLDTLRVLEEAIQAFPGCMVVVVILAREFLVTTIRGLEGSRSILCRRFEMVMSTVRV